MPADLAPATLTATGLLRLHQGFLRPALRGELCNRGSGWAGGGTESLICYALGAYSLINFFTALPLSVLTFTI